MSMQQSAGVCRPATNTCADRQIWAHGYVVLPMLCACRTIIGLLARHACTLDELCYMLNGNNGHISVALRTMRALGWLSMEGSKFVAPSHLLAAAEQPMLHGLSDDMLKDEPMALSMWLDAASDGWQHLPLDTELPPRLRELLSGAVLTPLLLQLRRKQAGASRRDRADLRSFPAPVARSISKLMAHLGLAHESSAAHVLILTSQGATVNRENRTLHGALRKHAIP